MRIRVANESDAEALATLAGRTFQDTFGTENRPEDMDAYVAATFGTHLQQTELRDPGCTVLLAEQDRDLVGYSQLISSTRVPPGIPAHAIEIQRFYVDRRYHGTGVARTLMQGTLDRARAGGASVVWLGVWERNARAIAFYRKYGFTDVGSQPFRLGEDVQTDRIMRRGDTNTAKLYSPHSCSVE